MTRSIAHTIADVLPPTQRPMASTVVKVLSKAIVAQLEKEGAVSIPGVGVLRLAQSKERVARNPKTGETVLVPARTRVKFRPARDLLARVVQSS